MMDLVALVGKHVYSINGVITSIKSFGNVQLGYGIKKLDGRHYQMTMMATPNINKKLLYLNKEDRLLRWLLVKHGGTKYGLDFLSEEEGREDFSRFQGNVFNGTDSDGEMEEDSSDYSSDEYEAEEGEEGEKNQSKVKELNIPCFNMAEVAFFFVSVSSAFIENAVVEFQTGGDPDIWYERNTRLVL